MPNQFIAIACFLAVSTPVLAQAGAPALPPDAWQVQVGGGALVTPEFKGSRDHRTRVLPYVSVRYSDLFSASVQDGAALNLYRAGGFTLGPAARFRFGQDEEDSSALRGLGDVDPSFEPGIFVNYRRGALSARLSVGQDTIGGHGGGVAELSGALTVPVARTPVGPILLSAGPRVSLVTSKVNRAFFGVDPVQSAASALPVYNPSGGLQEIGMNMTVIYPLNRRLSVVGFLGYGRLLGDAADSPLVRERGSPNEVSGGVFMAYSLF